MNINHMKGVKVMKKLLCLMMSLLLVAALFVGCAQKEDSKTDVPQNSEQKSEDNVSNDEIYVAVISKGFQHEFWQTVKLGADTAGKELGIKVTFEGPKDESMVAEQVAMVENAIAKKADAILLAALDTEALVPVVEKAHDAGIPVLMFDSNVNSDIPLSFVATDNVAAGALAAKEMAKMIGGKGKIGIIAHNEGTSTAIERRDGFKNEIEKNYPDIEIVGIQYSDGDHAKALAKATDMMTRTPDLAGIYATNEGSAIGVATAVQEKDKAGQVKVVGFDSSEAEINFLKNDVIQGFVVQNPFKMGYLGVKGCYDAIKGNPVESRIDTGATFVSKDNLDTEEVQKLLYPLGKK
ncbi:MAG: ribose transport system substrate-binding protein [Clostridiales bacterium]|jgi:ribose transport system substrate-binding protein|nr:ribose transport system substrate-binding protein [Clostridiales bacterium]MDK2933698.1 ribose transport system substrate-binding protein [Clostridiales bacterium]